MATDPFKELFERIDPTRGLSDADIDKMVAEAKIVERAIERVTSFRRRRWYQRRWRRTAVISIAVIASLSGAATAVTLIRSGVSDPTQMLCFSQDSIHSEVIVQEPYGSHLLLRCAKELHWKSSSSKPAPGGLLCVLPDGTLGGFPPSTKNATCAALGLQTFDGHLVSPRLLAFERAADNYFARHTCSSLSAAKSKMEELIVTYGLTAWQVRVSGSTSPTACATLGIESDDHAVDIVEVIEEPSRGPRH